MTAPATVLVTRSRRELAEARAGLRGSVAVVMTMGALHEGHAELVREARRLADSVVVTVFVNPLQFGPAEDLDRYPRTLHADVELVSANGADLVFAPTPDVVYPQTPAVRVGAGPLGEVLEGASRPGHFDGVLTVVLKLLHLVRPDVALFGEKDAQQLACIRRMVRDLDVPVQVVGVPTVREPDGLALSSRNHYLAADERRAAAALSRALREVADTGSLAAGRAVLDAEPLVVTDYLERVDPESFAPAPDGELAVVAARVGTTRLIDNLHLGKA
jgi:pantoate--beta-alanine ligase